MEMTNKLVKTNVEKKPREGFFSKPLFQQSIKSNWVLWLVLTLGSAAIFVIVNLVVGTHKLFNPVDMNAVQTYLTDEGIPFLGFLGGFDAFGFSLNRIQVMSNIDINAVLNDIIYKIAGVFLPMIYVMITANKLIASQVSDGSMAYVLSTPTSRKKVVRTQYSFLILSLIAMYLIIAICAFATAIIAFYIAPEPDINVGTVCLRTVLYCLGSFCGIFALAGVCFFASCWFNKSNQSIALGGGACVLAFLCCVLGLFGNKVFVAVGVGVQAMDFFNYLTIFTLIDTDAMSNFAKVTTGCYGVQNLNWVWESFVLVGIGAIFSIIGAVKFTKKDLPL